MSTSLKILRIPSVADLRPRTFSVPPASQRRSAVVVWFRDVWPELASVSYVFLRGPLALLIVAPVFSR